MGSLQKFADTPVEPFHHTIGLGCAGLGQTVFNLNFSTYFIKGMFASRFALAIDRKTVGESFTIIG